MNKEQLISELMASYNVREIDSNCICCTDYGYYRGDVKLMLKEAIERSKELED